MPPGMIDRGNTVTVRNRVYVPSTGYSSIGDWTVHTQDIGLLMVSLNHPKKNGKYQGGGPFALYKRKITGAKTTVYCGNNGVYIDGEACVGYVPGAHVPGSYTAPTYSSIVNEINQNADFATGYKKARPGNPVASVGQFMYELYTDLPQIPFKMLRKLKSFQALGHEYLNVQFGWLPFVSDLKKMYNLTKTIDARLGRLVRDNGKVIHREATVRSSTDTSTISSVHTDAPFSDTWGTRLPLWGSGTTDVLITAVTTERVWFSADFRYYTPNIGSPQWNRRAVATLFGANPTPDMLYQILPWSWLLDWFTNVGDVISNASSNAVDNLVADHAYIMRHWKREVTTSVRSEWRNHGQEGMVNGSFSLMSTDTEESKTRGMGNPFLPSLSITDFTSRQAGIAAALGISRS